jgi:UDPglucose 6-dehydrogenase
MTMESDSESFRQSGIQGVMKRIKAREVEVVVYEPSMRENEFYNSRIIRDREEFFSLSDVIVDNRMEKELEEVKVKVYTCDLFSRD